MPSLFLICFHPPCLITQQNQKLRSYHVLPSIDERKCDYPKTLRILRHTRHFLLNKIIMLSLDTFNFNLVVYVVQLHWKKGRDKTHIKRSFKSWPREGLRPG